MCGGDDHLAWKHPVSLEACKGLHIAGGYDRLCQGSFNPPILQSHLNLIGFYTQLGFHSYTWVHLWTFRAALVTTGFSYPLHGLLLVCSEIGTCLSFSSATFQHCDQCVSIISQLPSCHFSFHVFVPYRSVIHFSLDSNSQIKVGDRLIRVSKQSGMDPQHDTIDRLTVTMTLFRRH